MQRINPYFDEESNKNLEDFSPEMREAYLDVTRTHYKLLERLSQR